MDDSNKQPPVGLKLPIRYIDDFPVIPRRYRAGPLFKYMRREFAERMLKDGAVRVGTLVDFQSVEKYGTAIGDEREGHRVGQIMNQPGRVTTVSNLVNEKVNLGTVDFMGSGIAIQQEEYSPNYIIYCATAKADRKAMEEFGCDTCVQIIDVDGFFEALTEALLSQDLVESEVDIHRCVYREKTFHLVDDRQLSDGVSRVPLWLHKEPRFAYQKEVRARWRPKGQAVPVVVEAEGIAAMCRIIRL